MLLALRRCHDSLHSMTVKLNAAKIIVLSLINTNGKFDRISRSLRIHGDLASFFDWYRQRVRAASPPLLIIMVNEFFNISTKTN